MWKIIANIPFLLTPSRQQTASQLTSRKRTRSESGEEIFGTPLKSRRNAVGGISPLGNPATPDKFKNMTTEDIEKMGEEDRLEYTIHVSMKEASPNNNNNTEEEDMAAAIQVNRPLIVGDSYTN